MILEEDIEAGIGDSSENTKGKMLTVFSSHTCCTSQTKLAMILHIKIKQIGCN